MAKQVSLKNILKNEESIMCKHAGEKFGSSVCLFKFDINKHILNGCRLQNN